MSRSKVVITDYVWDNLNIEHRELSDIADIISFKNATPEEFIGEASNCEALLNTYAGPITRDLMEKMPNCLIISRYGIGVDTIDLDAATDLGIIVTNNPTYCVDEVADHAMALLLAVNRKITFYDHQVRDNGWSVAAGKPILPLRGRTLGLVGFGKIARQVAARAAGFGLRVLYSDPHVSVSGQDVPAEKTTFEDLLERSDILSLHTPLTAGTRGMIDEKAFKRMKPGALLINVARGPIVDTNALVKALDDGTIAGCGLDTTDPEPLPTAHPLRDRPNVVITPHAAWYSEQSMVRLQSGAPSEIRRLLNGIWPANVANNGVQGRTRAGI